jgi:hypothetical protein
MLKVRMKGRMMKDISDIAGVLIDEVNLRFRKDGLLVEIVDPAHVAMARMMADRSLFEVYEVEPIEMEYRRDKGTDIFQEDVVMLDLDKIREIFRAADVKGCPEWVEIRRLPEGDANHFDYELEVSAPGPVWNNSMIVRMRKADETCIPKMPNFKHRVKATFVPEHLKRAMRYMEILGGFVTLSTIGTDDLWIDACSDTVEAKMIVAKVVEGTALNSKVHLPTDYFGNMVRALNSIDMMDLEMDTDKPVVLKGYTHDLMDVIFMLAPRIEGN